MFTILTIIAITPKVEAPCPSPVTTASLLRLLSSLPPSLPLIFCFILFFCLPPLSFPLLLSNPLTYFHFISIHKLILLLSPFFIAVLLLFLTYIITNCTAAKWNSGDNPVLVAFGSIMACVVAASIGERIAGN